MWLFESIEVCQRDRKGRQMIDDGILMGLGDPDLQASTPSFLLFGIDWHLARPELGHGVLNMYQAMSAVLCYTRSSSQISLCCVTVAISSADKAAKWAFSHCWVCSSFCCESHCNAGSDVC